MFCVWLDLVVFVWFDVCVDCVGGCVGVCGLCRVVFVGFFSVCVLCFF